MVCSPWDPEELDTTEATQQQQQVDLSFSSKEEASFNFMTVVTTCTDFGVKENKASHVSIVSPSICHKVMGPDAMILVF